MADKIKVNTGRMRQDVDNVIAFVKQINGGYSDLVQKKVMLDAAWDGPASESFKKVVDDDLVALMTMVANLTRVYEYEDMARERYSQCENQISGEIAGI